MNTSAFGLDIGSSSIKAVWLEKQAKGYKLLSAITLPSPPKGMLSDALADQEQMAAMIKRAVIDGKIKTQKVCISLPENQVYTKVLDMPVLSDKELSSAIYWEAEQYIPVPLVSVTLDWQVLSRPKEQKGGTMQILLVGAPTALLNKYINILKMATLRPAAVETEVLSTIRALVASPNFPTTLIITIGAVSTSLVIVREGVLVFTYSIPVGGVAINRAIATDFGFTNPQAEEYKKIYGMSTETLGGKIGQATKPILLSIVQEVKKALSFYSQKYKTESPIQQILLSGGTAKLPGLNLFFAQQCNVETAIASPWNVLASQSVAKEVIADASDYTIAVGLAMREV